MKKLIPILAIGLLSGLAHAEIDRYQLTQKIETWEGSTVQDTEGNQYIIYGGKILVNPHPVGYMTYNHVDNIVVQSVKVCDQQQTICTPEQITIYEFLGVNISGGWILYDTRKLSMVIMGVMTFQDGLVTIDDSQQDYTTVLKWEVIN
jgi:hypothetical protein